jgi:hypothetical protein
MARIADFSDMLKFAHAELPGCPQPLFNQHIIQAGRLFCTKAWAWREDLTAYDLVAEQQEYTLAPITGGETYAARIEAIVKVRWNTEEGVTNGDDGNVQNYRTYAFDPNTNVLNFSVAPRDTVEGGLDVAVILVPHLSATDMNDWVLNIYAETILAGAMFTLKNIPKTDWQDSAGAALAYRTFRTGVGKAKGDIARQSRDGSIGASA